MLIKVTEFDHKFNNPVVRAINRVLKWQYHSFVDETNIIIATLDGSVVKKFVVDKPKLLGFRETVFREFEFELPIPAEYLRNAS